MILTYKEYIEYIKEGLITTHNIEKCWGSLEIELNFIGVKHKIDIDSKFIFYLEILNSKELDNDAIEFSVQLTQNILGYFPSYIWVINNFGKNGFKFDKKYLNNKYSNIIIRFEAKYEDGAYKNNLTVPDFAYHLSPENKKEKILRDGLCPKSGYKKTNHPDRIYLFYKESDYENLLKSLKLSDKLNGSDNKYILYKVKLSDKMIIHSDPNYINGFYTTDNIGPLNLEILKEDL